MSTSIVAEHRVLCVEGLRNPTDLCVLYFFKLVISVIRHSFHLSKLVLAGSGDTPIHMTLLHGSPSRESKQVVLEKSAEVEQPCDQVRLGRWLSEGFASVE